MFPPAQYRQPLHSLRVRHSMRMLCISLIAVLGLSISACSALAPAQPLPEAPKIAPLNVALVLGGGGAKGFAHVG